MIPQGPAAPPQNDSAKQILIIIGIVFGVVVVIIAILASMTLAGLGGARSKAKDARIKSDVSQTRSLAEIYYENHQTYVGLTISPDIQSDIESSDSQLTIQGLTDKTYVIYAELPSANTLYCVDNQGFSGEVKSISPSKTSCQ